MPKDDVVKQCKKIQSQLSRDNIFKPDGKKFTLEDVRNAIAQYCGEYDYEMELTSEMCDAVLKYIKESQSALLANSGKSVPLVNTIPSSLSVKEQDKIIKAVAKQIDVSLPVEALRDIANSVDWALSSRLELMQQLREQIRLWANHKLQEVLHVSEDIRNQTSQLFVEVSNQIQDTIDQDNAKLLTQAENMKAQVETSVEKFRNSSSAILSIFSIPA